MPEQTTDYHVEEERQREGINEEKPMPETESNTDSSYGELAHNDRRRLNRNDREKHQRRILGLDIKDRCDKLSLPLFEESDEGVKRNIYILCSELMEQAVVIAFFTGKADEPLDNKI